MRLFGKFTTQPHVWCTCGKRVARTGTKDAVPHVRLYGELTTQPHVWSPCGPVCHPCRQPSVCILRNSHFIQTTNWPGKNTRNETWLVTSYLDGTSEPLYPTTIVKLYSLSMSCSSVSTDDDYPKSSTSPSPVTFLSCHVYVSVTSAGTHWRSKLRSTHVVGVRGLSYLKQVLTTKLDGVRFVSE